MPASERAPIIEIRRHPLLLFGRCWQPALLMLLAALAAVAVATVSETPANLLAGWLLRLIFLAFVGGGIWAAWRYLEWGYDALYLTERRLIERAGIPRISERRREVSFDRIQSVAIEQRSLLMRWYGCGDLIVDVAGAGPLRFVGARDILALRRLLQARIDGRQSGDPGAVEAEIRASVRELLAPDPPAALAPKAAPLAHAAATGRRGRLARWTRRPRFGRRFEGVVWRRHGWFLVRRALAPAALIAAAVATPFAIGALALDPLARYAGFLALCEVVVAGAWLAWLWVDWRNDHYVVTGDRLIEIEQLPLGLRQRISEAVLTRVQDIHYRVPNPLAHLLNYGDVAVHTAGESAPFTFRGVARPRELAAAIDRQVASFRLAEEAARRQALREEFAHWLNAYEALRDPTPARAEPAARPLDDA